MKQVHSLQRQHRKHGSSATTSLAEPTHLFAPATSPSSLALPHERQERPALVAHFKHSFDRISIHPPVPDGGAGYEVEQSDMQQMGTQSASVQRKEAGRQPTAQEGEPLQKAADLSEAQENMTGLPDSLKGGIESLSGLPMDDVSVHFNSPKPAQVDALAYTQGTEIHVGPGQEQHLAHEAWHVVQQMQGRVQPTLQAKGVAINDDVGLEREADVMGLQAINNQMPVQAKGTMTIMPTRSDTSVTLYPTEQDTLQRMMPSGLQQPQGYMTVSLQATLNGYDLGNAWSRRTSYSIGSEHAEDALVDFIQSLEAAFASNNPLWVENDPALMALARTLAYGRDLVINGLTASPCSSEYGTCKKGDMSGCAERLIELRNSGFNITINANHYYQPQGVNRAKDRSRAACQDMANAGIVVNIANQ